MTYSKEKRDPVQGALEKAENLVKSNTNDTLAVILACGGPLGTESPFPGNQPYNPEKIAADAVENELTPYEAVGKYIDSLVAEGKKTKSPPSFNKASLEKIAFQISAIIVTKYPNHAGPLTPPKSPSDPKKPVEAEWSAAEVLYNKSPKEVHTLLTDAFKEAKTRPNPNENILPTYALSETKATERKPTLEEIRKETQTSPQKATEKLANYITKRFEILKSNGFKQPRIARELKQKIQEIEKSHPTLKKTLPKALAKILQNTPSYRSAIGTIKNPKLYKTGDHSKAFLQRLKEKLEDPTNETKNTKEYLQFEIQTEKPPQNQSRYTTSNPKLIEQILEFAKNQTPIQLQSQIRKDHLSRQTKKSNYRSISGTLESFDTIKNWGRIRYSSPALTKNHKLCTHTCFALHNAHKLGDIETYIGKPIHLVGKILRKKNCRPKFYATGLANTEKAKTRAESLELATYITPEINQELHNEQNKNKILREVAAKEWTSRSKSQLPLEKLINSQKYSQEVLAKEEQKTKSTDPKNTKPTVIKTPQT
jgi:hypothetical protein